MKLYGFFRSSAAYRVRLALNIKGVEYEHAPVDMYKDGGLHTHDDYAAKNPLRLVPTLELDDGTFIQESLAMIEYIDAVHGGPKLIPEDPREAARVRAASYAIACDIHPINNMRVLNYLTDPLGCSEEQINQWYSHWVRDGGLLGFQEMIESQGQFCFGDQLTMADCLLIPQLFNARRLDVSLNGLERLVEIESNCNQLPAFKEAHPSVQVDAW